MDKNKQQTINSGLYLVSTPIGNMEDITFRALNVLKKSNIILCEDTRRSGKLLSYFKIKNELLSYHKFNEKKISNKAIDYIKNNKLDKILKNLSNLNYSIVFFIPGSKINYYILKFKDYFIDRKILIAKEMTKIHEAFIRGKVSSIGILSENMKGEFTVVLSEKIKAKNIEKKINESVKIEIKKMIKKYSHRDVVEFISKKEDLPKKIIYNFCLKLKN